MGYREEEGKDAELSGCKYAFGCAMLLAFLLIVTMPFSGLMLWLEIDSWGF